MNERILWLEERCSSTVLPQGFKNKPTLFGGLGKRSRKMEKKSNSVLLLQCVDEILIGDGQEQTSLKVTISLQNFLGLAGISRKKGKTNTLPLR